MRSRCSGESFCQVFGFGGVGPESLVGVAVRRSVDLLVAVYGVLRAGGGYVPVDPDQPAERNGYVLAAASPVCVVSTS